MAAHPAGRSRAPREWRGDSCRVLAPPACHQCSGRLEAASVVDDPGGAATFALDRQLGRDASLCGGGVQAVATAQPPDLGGDVRVDQKDALGEVVLSAALEEERDV